MAAAPPPGGGQQLVAAAAERQLAAASMPPPPPRAPKRKEVVLDEDEYTATLEAIIERDFFPELPKLESKIAWLQAVRSGNPEQIRQAQLLIAQRRAAAAAGRPMTGLTPAGAPLFTPGGTAARVLEGDTPYIPMLPPGIPAREGTGAGVRPGTAANPAAPAGEEGAGAAAAAVADVGAAPPVSLDQFLAQHTSEDNASFQEILEAVNARKRQKHAKQLTAGPDPKLLITDGREKTDGFGTTGQDPSTLVTWKHNPKNTLFYGKEKDVVPYSDAEMAAQVQGAPKAINHSGTRFPKDLQRSASATPSSSSAGGSVAAGSGRGAAGAAAGGAGPAGRGAAALAAAAGGTRGYDILATPSFDPGVESTPFMTWGDIEGTPLRIEAEDLPPGPLMEGGPSFFIKEGSAKEQKMRELANKAGASLRKKGTSLRGATPVVTSTLAAAAAARRQGTGLPGGGAAAAAARPPSARPASGRPPTGAAAAGQKPLSEAARRLASSLHRGRQGKADDLGLRASYRGATPGSSRRGATPATSAGGFGSSWSMAPTPSRGGSVAPSPAVHATLEEEEARVQALLRAQQKELEGKAQLEEARTAAVKAMQHVTQSGPQPRVERPAAAAAQQQQQAADGGGDLTAGLLNL